MCASTPAADAKLAVARTVAVVNLHMIVFQDGALAKTMETAIKGKFLQTSTFNPLVYREKKGFSLSKILLLGPSWESILDLLSMIKSTSVVISEWS